MADEVWKVIAGGADCYEVSNSGRVINRNTGRLRNPTLTSHGYHVVSFRRSGKQTLHYLHDLVAAAFVGEKPKAFTVNHINGVKTDNRSENLEFLSNVENVVHAQVNGLCDNRGERHGYSKLTDADIPDIRNMIEERLSDPAIGKRYGVATETIRCVRIRKTWRHVAAHEVT